MNHQEQRRREIELPLLTFYTNTFIPRQDCHSRQLSDGSYVAIKRKLTLGKIEAHLLGRLTLGAYALDTHSHARWICFDADDEAEWKGLLNLSQWLKDFPISVPSYIEPSRRGGHLWLFLDPLPGADARRMGKHLLQKHNLAVELYPKQDTLRTGAGSLVRLPLGIHQLTQRRYHFVDLSGLPLAPTIREQVALLAQPQKVPSEFVKWALSQTTQVKCIIPSHRYTPLSKEAYSGLVSERIKHSISVYDFVSQFVQLDRGGRGLCPYHDDHKESLSVNQEGNFWHCFAGCGGGSVIDFWMKWRARNHQDSSFKATVTELEAVVINTSLLLTSPVAMCL